MKITSKKTDDQNIVLTINVQAADYQPGKKKKINDIRRNAEFPGFRKGMVPASLIEKRYGESVLVEAVNDVIAEALKNYIQEQKLNIIGEPLPTEDRKEQEWKDGNDFEFTFDVALNPEVKLELGKDDTVTSYTISVSAEDKKKLAEAYKKQQEAIAEAAAKDGREAPEAKTDEQLDKQVAEELKREYEQASTFRLDKDIRDYCVNKAALSLPEKFLRRWLIVANEGKYTEEQIDKEFDAFLADYRWQLVMGALTEKYSVKVDNEDIRQEAKNFARYQYSMYGMNDVPEEQLDSFADSMMGDEQSIQRMYENVQNRKVIAAVKEDITVKSKKITSEKFRELK